MLEMQDLQLLIKKIKAKENFLNSLKTCFKIS